MPGARLTRAAPAAVVISRRYQVQRAVPLPDMGVEVCLEQTDSAGD